MRLVAVIAGVLAFVAAIAAMYFTNKDSTGKSKEIFVLTLISGLLALGAAVLVFLS